MHRASTRSVWLRSRTRSSTDAPSLKPPAVPTLDLSRTLAVDVDQVVGDNVYWQVFRRQSLLFICFDHGVMKPYAHHDDDVGYLLQWVKSLYECRSATAPAGTARVRDSYSSGIRLLSMTFFHFTYSCLMNVAVSRMLLVRGSTANLTKEVFTASARTALAIAALSVARLSDGVSAGPSKHSGNKAGQTFLSHCPLVRINRRPHMPGGGERDQAGFRRERHGARDTGKQHLHLAAHDINNRGT